MLKYEKFRKDYIFQISSKCIDLYTYALPHSSPAVLENT